MSNTLVKELTVIPKKLSLGELSSELPTMSEADVIESLSGHLMAMDKPSRLEDDSSCAYDGVNGACCVAAVFINGYRPLMEEKGWGFLVSHFNQSPEHKELISTFQFIHDDEDFWEYTRDDKIGLINERVGSGHYTKTQYAIKVK